MARQCFNCRKVSTGEVCEGCGFVFDTTARSRRTFAETCLRIGVVITIAASVTAFIAKLI